MSATEPGDSRRRWWLPAVYLTVVGVVAAAAVLGTDAITRARIARNESAQVLKVLRTVLPEGAYDNRPDLDRIMVTDPTLLGSREPLPVYRARRGDQPVAAVITTVTRAGYAGPIRLLVGVDAAGAVIAVHVIAHTETPGIGDRIEEARSDWIRRFTRHSLRDPEPSGWGVRADGGTFDQLTGATITSRAVVRAVRDAELYFDNNKDLLLAAPPRD